MTREEKLWTMNGTSLANIAEGLGIKVKVSGNKLKEAKEGVIKKILEAESNTVETADEEYTEEDFKKPVDTPVKTKDELAPVIERKRGVKITFNGKSQNICAWAKELGVHPNTLYRRLYDLKWPLEKAFTMKVRFKTK